MNGMIEPFVPADDTITVVIPYLPVWIVHHSFLDFIFRHLDEDIHRRHTAGNDTTWTRGYVIRVPIQRRSNRLILSRVVQQGHLSCACVLSSLALAELLWYCSNTVSIKSCHLTPVTVLSSIVQRTINDAVHKEQMVNREGTERQRNMPDARQ